jgi:ABC-type transport system involved in cytochrome bd biosynthesis fused ATPase/permease subunit
MSMLVIGCIFVLILGWKLGIVLISVLPLMIISLILYGKLYQGKY